MSQKIKGIMKMLTMYKPVYGVIITLYCSKSITKHFSGRISVGCKKQMTVSDKCLLPTDAIEKHFKNFNHNFIFIEILKHVKRDPNKV